MAEDTTVGLGRTHSFIRVLGGQGSGRRQLAALGWLGLALAVVLVAGCRRESSALTGDRNGAPHGTLEMTLLPRMKPTPGVAVIYELSGPVAMGVKTLALAPEWSGVRGVAGVHHLLVRDKRGVIDTVQNHREGRFTLQREVRGPWLRVSYLAAADGTRGSGEPNVRGRLNLQVTPSTVSGVGYSFMALPEVDVPFEVRLHWALRAVQATGAATSFGVGTDVVTTAKPLDLAHSIYLAGPMVVLDGEAEQRLVVMGDPVFEADDVLRFCSAVLGAGRQMFDPADRDPYTFVFLAEPGLGSHHDGAALYRSFSVWFDRTRSLDARLRILVAHEVVHRWVGRALRFTTPEGADAKWFSEGFTVHFARSLLHRQGLLSTAEYLDDVRRDQRAHRAALAEAQRPHRGHAPPPNPATAYHRGALYAARLATQLGSADQSLEQLVLSLLEKASSSGNVLPESAWKEAVVAALGPGAGAEFDRLVVQSDRPIEVSLAALRGQLAEARSAAPQPLRGGFGERSREHLAPPSSGALGVTLGDSSRSSIRE